VITRSVLFRKRLAAWLRPDPLGELKCSPRPPSRIRWLGPQEGRGREGMGKEGKGENEGERGEGRKRKGGKGREGREGKRRKSSSPNDH